MSKRLTRIAPKELIKQDYAVLQSTERLDTTPAIQNLIFMQSIEGRSHNGSGIFNKETYVNTTIDDVVHALDRDPSEVKAARQVLIDDIVEFVKDTLNDRSRDRLIDSKGEPFLGIPIFKELKVNPRDVLRGIYIGGLRDNPDVRKKTEELYEVKIGCGECHLIDVGKMIKMDLDGEKLAHEAHEDKIQDYIKSGLIIEDEDGQKLEANKQIRYFYVRHRLGPGQSDDAALVMAGILYNIDVALGVFLADAIDTLEKYASTYKDQDQELAFFIARGFKELKISMDDVYELTYLSSIPQNEEEMVPDSSLRYLISLDQRTSRTALKTHLAFIQDEPIVELPVSFKRILSTQFYEYVRRRLLNARRLDRLSLPKLSIQELTRPVKEIMKENFIMISKDASLAELMEKFKAAKCEIIIITNKNNKVVGTISATDLIHFAKYGS